MKKADDFAIFQLERSRHWIGEKKMGWNWFMKMDYDDISFTFNFRRLHGNEEKVLNENFIHFLQGIQRFYVNFIYMFGISAVFKFKNNFFMFIHISICLYRAVNWMLNLSRTRASSYLESLWSAKVETIIFSTQQSFTLYHSSTECFAI